MTPPPKIKLPYGRQCIEADDIAAVTKVLEGEFLTTGPAVQSFEKALAQRLKAPHAVSCSSATAGLHLAMMAAGIGEGDTVIAPAVTFLATANSARYVGAEVLFADVDADTGLMLPGHLEEALAEAGRKPVKAVLPVAFAGQTPPPAQIQRIAAGAGAIVIEDACHGLGTTYREGAETFSLGACSHSEMAVFSFHPVKTIAMGEGGAVTTRKPELEERLARLRNHGMSRQAGTFTQKSLAFDQDGTPNPWYYEMAEFGFNYRASDINCALGLSQLGKLDRFISRRAELVGLYDRELAALAPMVTPLGRVPNCDPGWHLYVALFDFDRIGMSRAAMIKQLAAKGIGSQVHYLPVSHQPYYRARYGEPNRPGAETYYKRCLSLPLYPQMTDADVTVVVEALKEILRRG